MTLKQYLDRDGMTLADLARRIGKSRSHLHAIKEAGRCSATTALAIERETDNAVNAADLNPAIAEARKAAA